MEHLDTPEGEEEYSVEFFYKIENDEAVITDVIFEEGEVTIPAEFDGIPVTRIDEDAFYYSEITAITIPEGVTEIGECAFEKCYDLVKVTLPQSLTRIGSGAFLNCVSLEQINLPPNLKEISDRAFEVCSSLKRIVIPEGVTCLGSCVFSHSGVTELVLPKSLAAAPWKRCEPFGTFLGSCEDLENIFVEPGNPLFSSIDGILYSADKKTLLHCPCKRQGAVQIPAGTTVIDSGAFAGCEGITHVLIPEGVERILAWAFSDTSITSLTLPASLTELGVKLNRPDKTPYDTFPGYYHMAFDFQTKLEEIHVAEGNPRFTSINGVLYTADGTTLLRYPPNCKAQLFLMPREVEVIAAEAFFACKNLTHILLWNKPYKIGDRAFIGCDAKLERLL